jgi:hypothetical protein
VSLVRNTRVPAQMSFAVNDDSAETSSTVAPVSESEPDNCPTLKDLAYNVLLLAVIDSGQQLNNGVSVDMTPDSLICRPGTTYAGGRRATTTTRRLSGRVLCTFDHRCQMVSTAATYRTATGRSICRAQYRRVRVCVSLTVTAGTTVRTRACAKYCYVCAQLPSLATRARRGRPPMCAI